MKLVYSNENHFVASNVKNLIEAQGIETIIKNEFAQGAVGEISAFDAWPEIWVVNDSDFEAAVKIAEASNQENNRADWFCRKCKERNAASFEICWNCQQPMT